MLRAQAQCGARRVSLLLMATAKMTKAVEGLSALAHDGRLSVFRLLVRHGKDGLAAGDIARKLDVLPNTLSTNLTVLSNAGLVRSRRDGRSIIYTPDFDRMSELLAYLVEDCCNGDVAVCAPLAAVANRACC